MNVKRVEKKAIAPVIPVSVLRDGAFYANRERERARARGVIIIDGSPAYRAKGRTKRGWTSPKGA